MAEINITEVRAYLDPLQGREVALDTIRRDLGIDMGSKSWDGVRNIMFRLAEQRIVKPSGKRDGIYKVITQVVPVKVFGAKHKNEPFALRFPKDYNTGMELEIANHIVLRAGDLILIAGASNYGKTALAINFLAENIDQYSCVLMGNEYTGMDGKVTPRLINRLEAMDWVEWVDEFGGDKFTLLPVQADFAEYVQKDKINIIDWIDIDTGEHYLIGGILKGIKKNVGDGIAIAVIQKSETSESGRGGQFTKDYADVELLIDPHGSLESRLTVGKVKEYNQRVTGRSWAYGILGGVKLINVREVAKCHDCFGKGWKKSGMSNIPCPTCNKLGWVDKH